MIKMYENEPVEYIVIKPESIELFNEDWIKDDSINPDQEFPSDNIDECCFVIPSGEVIRLNNEDTIKTPFYLESYFLDNDRFRSKSPSVPTVQYIVEVDRVSCFECDIVFCNEHKLLEHLMTHIDIHRMGCNVCDRDLNSEEKFHLHTMAVTWQSVYYCDFCRKSCAGVVRSKSQPPPPGKTYMCHDCEYLTNPYNVNFQSLKSRAIKPTFISLPPLEVPILNPVSQPTEVLQDHKQKPANEAKHENSSTENSTPEMQDCCKPHKENKKTTGSKPRVKVVSECMKQTPKMTTRSQAKEQLVESYECSECQISFKDEYCLMQHMKNKHKFHKLRYICKFCDKEFTQQRSYEKHVRIHQLAKNYMCFLCNIAFLSKSELVHHARCYHNVTGLINTYCDDTNNVALELQRS
ncbi:zinc finger protein 28-like [Copidosoma floridanum]|uniref:zinc finger protein 28-like n=1 Tax=Copidosoma floridanum TaxID=29053 RepID=UPI0006C94F78|nr:zinc finger protein 28-like [Copidosoma floridanum]